MISNMWLVAFVMRCRGLVDKDAAAPFERVLYRMVEWDRLRMLRDWRYR